MTDTRPKHRILVTAEGGVIQGIEGIPGDIVIEVRDFDRDGDREHPAWSDEHRAVVAVWEGRPTAAPPRYTVARSADGTDETFDVLDGGEVLVSVPSWGAAEEAEAKAWRIAEALNYSEAKSRSISTN